MPGRVERFGRQVPADLRRALKFYGEIDPELRERFREAVRRTWGEVRERPESFGRVTDSDRFARVEGFPYIVVFRDSSVGLLFTGVHHRASDPQSWIRDD